MPVPVATRTESLIDARARRHQNRVADRPLEDEGAIRALARDLISGLQREQVRREAPPFDLIEAEGKPVPGRRRRDGVGARDIVLADRGRHRHELSGHEAETFERRQFEFEMPHARREIAGR
jgi:hypothetical protein